MEALADEINKLALEDHYRLIYEEKEWDNVKEELIQISKKELDLKQIVKFIIHNATTYSEYKEEELIAVLKYEDTDLLVLFSKMALAILEFQEPHKTQPLPIFRIGRTFEWQYTKTQLTVLLSLMCFCLTIPQKSKTLPRNYNFSVIFGKEILKTRTVFLYLEQQLGKGNKQTVLLKRTVQPTAVAAQMLIQCPLPLSQLQIDTKGGIQDHYGSLKIDFANKFIGGGSLRHGKVQEQIMFINRPEMYTSCLFCERMEPNEAITFIGFRKYFREKGYADKVHYAGVETHEYNQDKTVVEEYIVAIDAIPKPKNQWEEAPVMREINKALVGFKSLEISSVATGNWGCGAFGGDVQLKFLLQWIACSLLKKKMIYCTFGNKRLVQVEKIAQMIKHVTVQDLFGALMKFKDRKQLFDHIYKIFK